MISEEKILKNTKRLSKIIRQNLKKIEKVLPRMIQTLCMVWVNQVLKLILPAILVTKRIRIRKKLKVESYAPTLSAGENFKTKVIGKSIWDCTQVRRLTLALNVVKGSILKEIIGIMKDATKKIRGSNA